MSAAWKTERGSSLAWTAVFLSTLLLPLLLLSVDGSRLLYLRGRLQTATDAACEDAAWLVGDRRRFLSSGETRFSDPTGALVHAQDTFARTLEERPRIDFQASLAITLDDPSGLVLCHARASAPILFQGGRALQVHIPASAAAAIRFR